MKLSKIYSNKPGIFPPVKFKDGLNVILARILDAKNEKKDTHNLGKTTLVRLIDFCLLSHKDVKEFPYSVEPLASFVFFLEVEAEEGRYVTICRSVEGKILHLKEHVMDDQDFSSLIDEENFWDHESVPFEKAKSILDGIFNLAALKPFKYRQALPFVLRGQGAYGDVFKPSKLAKSKDAELRPLIAHLLKFDDHSLKKLYSTEDLIKEKKNEQKKIERECSELPTSLDALESLIAVKEKQISELSDQLGRFSFDLSDAQINKQLVDELGHQIVLANERRYYLSQSIKKIHDSLENAAPMFSVEKAQKLFGEAQVLFEGQLKKSFEDLLAFRKSITEERVQYLQKDLAELEGQLKTLSKQREELEKKREQAVAALKEADIIEKFKEQNAVLSESKVTLLELRKKYEVFNRRMQIQKEIDKLKGNVEDLKANLFKNYAQVVRKDSKSFYQEVKSVFEDIVHSVLDRVAIIEVNTTKEMKLEYFTKFTSEKGDSTQEDRGNSYKKLLCFAFDLSLVIAYKKVNPGSYYEFLFHDGLLEGLDRRKQTQLISLMRNYAQQYDVQIITAEIDSTLPVVDGKRFDFEADEIVRELHDQGDSGRLFRMPPW